MDAADATLSDWLEDLKQESSQISIAFDVFPYLQLFAFVFEFDFEPIARVAVIVSRFFREQQNVVPGGAEPLLVAAAAGVGDGVGVHADCQERSTREVRENPGECRSNAKCDENYVNEGGAHEALECGNARHHGGRKRAEAEKYCPDIPLDGGVGIKSKRWR